MAGLYLETQLRPCKVKLAIVDKDKPWKITGHEVKSALFHCWAHISNVVEPSPMVGGHPGGIVSGTMGIVELENGKVVELTPSAITFIDNKHQEYAFD